MNLSEALSKVVGMVGRRLTVRVVPRGPGAPPPVAAFDGVLVKAPDLVPGTSQAIQDRLGEYLFFQMDDAERNNGFYVSAAHFEGADWDEMVPLLTLRLSTVDILVSPDD